MPISRQSADFLFENHMRNDRAWFKENRDAYKALVEAPMLELARELMPALLDIDPLITADPRRCLSRIWLDMRVNRSGEYFRDHMWLVFRRGKGVVYPSYYFEFSPRGYSWGVGYYTMPAGVMDTVRAWVLADDRRYQAAQKALETLPGLHLDGDEYKRKKFPDAPPEKQHWLNRKCLSVTHEGKDAGLLFSDRLAGMLKADFGRLAPIYRLLLEAHLQNLDE